MSAAPAYIPDARAAERERYAQPNISVVPGRGRAPQNQALAPSVVFAAKVAAVVLAVLAVLGFARVTLSSVAVTATVEAEQLTAEINTARIEGNQLEVAQSTLSNPSYIKGAAAALGMAAPEETTKVDLSGDVVVTDESGNLSLSGSLAAAAADAASA